MISVFELIIVACLILFLNGLGLYWFRKRWYNRFLVYKKETQRELANELSSDFHDEVGSHLAKIISIAGILKLNNTIHNQGEYLDKIIESSKSMFSGFGTLIWAIQSDRTRCRDIYLEISDFGNKLYDSSNTNFTCRIGDDGARRYMIQSSVKDVMLSIKELITNSMKHAKAKHIEVDFSIAKNLLQVTVTDDGLGFTIDNIQKSGGLTHLDKRSKRSNFEYSANTSKGSIFTLSIPIEHV